MPPASSDAYVCRESEWIGTGEDFADVPDYVKLAFKAELSLPQSIEFTPCRYLSIPGSERISGC